MRPLLIAAVLAALAGCQTQRVFYHPTKPFAEQQQDFAECDLRATEATAAVLNVWNQASAKLEIRNKCMFVRGYKAVQRAE